MKKTISIRKKYKKDILARFDIKNFKQDVDISIFINIKTCPLCAKYMKGVDCIKKCPFDKYKTLSNVGCIAFLESYAPNQDKFLLIGSGAISFKEKNMIRATQLLKRITDFLTAEVNWI